MTENSERQAWMSKLAKAPAADLARLWEGLGLKPEHEMLRAPEVGAVMVRGRTGATGAPFNLGEMTVTRCSLRLGCGAVGHGYVQGRNKGHATNAALVDALMQTEDAGRVREGIVGPLTEALVAAKAKRRAKAAATKVEFFTMQRGED
ncbi:phosphonate C-P lyase system protein PhnG [Roseovarius sp. SK2]|uniref:phosphonate C-P lyase system protein PhnG n=1 Tax=Roseovarius TaxID=74030 RepID=UPI00237C1D8E|nr:phosphonate C-P lyase system protein PhnG [Roseovarius sp. SK2]MDD9725126.1 phosphonate C-P lyase system protein PhnG [Roseovarius sp. SK2]